MESVGASPAAPTAAATLRLALYEADTLRFILCEKRGGKAQGGRSEVSAGCQGASVSL